MSAAARYCYIKNKQQFGPISAEEIKAMCAAAKLGRDDLVWQEGTPSWLPAAQIPGLFAAPPSAAPPPPPAPPPRPPQSLFHYLQGGQQRGPVSFEQLKALAASGQLRPADQVWQTGTPSWVPADKVPGLIPPPAPPRAAPPTTAPAGPPAAPPPGPPPAAPAARPAPPPGPAAPAGVDFRANRISFRYPADWRVSIKPGSASLADSWTLEVRGVVPGKDKPTPVTLFLQVFGPPIDAAALNDAIMESLKGNAEFRNLAFSPARATFGGQSAQAQDYKFGVKTGFWSTDPCTGQLVVTTLGDRAAALYWQIPDRIVPALRPFADMVRESFAIAPSATDDKPLTFAANGIELQHPAGSTVTFAPSDDAEIAWSLALESALGSCTLQFWPATTAPTVPLGIIQKSMGNVEAFSNLAFTPSSVPIAGQRADGFEISYAEAGQPASGQAHAVTLGKRTLALYWFGVNPVRSALNGMAEMLRGSLKLT
ncbi:MAG: DUF4339 domain-containing protein [Gemmataceae bacterium]